MATDKSNSKNELPDPRLFEVVAFGCHEKAYRYLGNFLRVEGEIRSFFFVEYFCAQPVTLAASKSKKRLGTKLFFPFIRRIGDQDEFLWASDGKGGFRFSPKTEEIVRDLSDPAKFIVHLSMAPIGREVMRFWTDPSGQKPIFLYSEPEWNNYLNSISKLPNHIRELGYWEFALLGQPWRAAGRAACIFAAPIATKTVFYGYLMLFVPVPDVTKQGDGGTRSPASNTGTAGGETSAIDAEKQTTIWSRLSKLANDIYLPVLTLLCESILETQLKSTIGAIPASKHWREQVRQFIRARVPFQACSGLANAHASCPKTDHPYDSSFEAPLHRLWDRRLRLLEGAARKTADKDRFLATLAFAKNFWASPGTVEQVKQVMGVNLPMHDENHKLSAALIYGGAGSGKDVLARMVSLFSDDYFSKETYTVNMAAIRPASITGPLLQGVRLRNLDTKGKEVGLHRLEGLLLEAKEVARRKSPANAKPREKKLGATFILDELNSLDVDLQGILLRILEQGEVVHLFDLERHYIQHLIVGVVNEDPEQISHQDELRRILGGSGTMGSLLSSFLYEVVRRSRRLREDLYHRLKRELNVRVPEIRDRPEDVPILFYTFAVEEAGKKSNGEYRDVVVELDAYRMLMDRRLTWPGNIRQIQAVAKSCFNELQSRTDRIDIGRMHIRRALMKEFRDVQFDEAHTERKEE